MLLWGIPCRTEVEIALERAQYDVNESESLLEVCSVLLQGKLDSGITATLFINDIPQPALSPGIVHTRFPSFHHLLMQRTVDRKIDYLFQLFFTFQFSFLCINR